MVNTPKFVPITSTFVIHTTPSKVKVHKDVVTTHTAR